MHHLKLPSGMVFTILTNNYVSKKIEMMKLLETLEKIQNLLN
jgi:hypothetical protein